jgi:hypothetical protein
MKKLMLWMMALAALPVSAFETQNITGNWQGTLQAGPQKVRVVFKIALENDKLQAPRGRSGRIVDVCVY